MKQASRFAKGSGLYACRSCGRQTRATGGRDNENVRLCVECYELGGIENAFLDGEGNDDLVRLARDYVNECRSKGGNISEDDFADIPFDTVAD